MNCKFLFRLTAYFVQLSQLFSIELHGSIASLLTLTCLLCLLATCYCKQNTAIIYKYLIKSSGEGLCCGWIVNIVGARTTNGYCLPTLPSDVNRNRNNSAAINFWHGSFVLGAVTHSRPAAAHVHCMKMLSLARNLLQRHCLMLCFVHFFLFSDKIKLIYG